MNGCEEMAEKLSAFLDGELSAEEVPALLDHLGGCPACRERKANFEKLDRLVSRASPGPSPALEGRIRTELTASKPHSAGVRRLAQISAAALILIAVSLVILVTGDRADAGRIAVPVAALQAMNLQAYEDQQALLKTFEWDLRAMKLMVNSSNQEEGKAREILEEIDRLLAKVKRLERDD